MTMLNELGGWRVTLPGSGVEAHLVRARTNRPCSYSAHALAGDRNLLPACPRTIKPGDVYVKVRTAAWPDPDSDMAAECAAEKGWVAR